MMELLTKLFYGTWLWDYSHSLLLVAIAGALDVATTKWGFSKGLVEGNPIMWGFIKLFEMFGKYLKVKPSEAAMAALIVTHLAFPIGGWIYRDSIGLLPMWTWTLMFTGVALNNYRLIRKFGK